VSLQFIDSARSRPKPNIASIGIDRPPATRHTSREDEPIRLADSGRRK
jgi:hypothetical protein